MECYTRIRKLYEKMLYKVTYMWIALIVVVLMCTVLIVGELREVRIRIDNLQENMIPEVTEITEIVEVPMEYLPEPEVTPQAIWYTEDELLMLAATIYYEAGSNECTDLHQQMVGQVVLNRISDDRFPDTIFDVINQKGQYSTIGNIMANYRSDIIPDRCVENARYVLDGNLECPDNVIYQANFKQGTGIYMTINTSYSVSYFCYG